MKKIMIYSKHSSSDSLLRLINLNSGLIMFYAVFISGLIFGCTLYNSPGANAYLEKAIKILFDNSIDKTLGISAAFTLITILISVTGAFSCAGIAVLCFVPAVSGVIFAQIASYLISTQGVKGMGYYSLIILPAAVIMAAAEILLCSESGNLSKKLTMSSLFGKREDLDIKNYFIKCFIILLAMLCSVFVYFISLKLFSKLF